MKNSLILAFLFSSRTLAGCITSTLVGESGPALNSDDVVVYYIDRPACNFETVAYISAKGGFYTLNSMLRRMRQEAASAGANGLYVLQTQQSTIKEYLATAKAIRCLPA